MNNPITNFQIGKSMHHEFDASYTDASYTDASPRDKLRLPTRVLLAASMLFGIGGLAQVVLSLV